MVRKGSGVQVPKVAPFFKIDQGILLSAQYWAGKSTIARPKKGSSMTATEIKRLYRSKKEKTIFGICGGIAEYFSVDPVLVRVGAVVLTVLSGGLGIFGYLIAYFIIPENPES